MQPISETFLEFKAAVSADVPVTVTSEGLWCVEGLFARAVRWLFGSSSLPHFLLLLDSLEMTRLHEPRYHIAAVAFQRLYPESWALTHRIYALAYRMNLFPLEKYNEALHQQVLFLACRWKKKPLTPAQEKRLGELFPYSAFAGLLIQERELQDLFFNWTLRDHNRVGPFVEFPGLTARMIDCPELSCRLGMYDLLKWNPKTKELCVPVCGRFYNIALDHLVMDLGRGYRVTLPEFFQVFKDRETHVGNIEATPSGFVNYNNYELGPYCPLTESYERISLSQRFWWRQLTPAARWSEADIRARIPFDWRGDKHALGSGRWFLSLVATSARPLEKVVTQTHAFLLIGIPAGDHYDIYPFGKFPRGSPKRAALLFSRVAGAILYPDLNFFYTKRKHVYVATTICPDAGSDLMEVIGQDVRLGLENRLSFQLFQANCFGWAVDRMSRFIPPVFFHQIGWYHVFHAFPLPSLLVFNLHKRENV